ncbi:MAG: glutaredoxin [Bdellovibrionales bacterium]|nr:glutaredoxin [Bdellovibrionales bacterium]NQZ18739.1 glutaredoxin [Bdellovibrionales bacterium]
MDIKLYVKDYCPYCKAVMNYLDGKNIAYTKVEVSDKPEIYAKLKQETGHQTVPQVFIDGKFIGGSDDFKVYAKENNI